MHTPYMLVSCEGDTGKSDMQGWNSAVDQESKIRWILLQNGSLSPGQVHPILTSIKKEPEKEVTEPRWNLH